MHAIRSLLVLLFAAGTSFAQAPKEEPQIAITARIITLHESDRQNLKFAHLWLSNNMNGRGKPGDPTLPEVLKGLEEFKTVTVTTLPKVTVFSGQNAEVTTGKPETVITGFDKNGPVQEMVHNGTQLKLKATLDKDGKVRINVDAKHTFINHKVPLTSLEDYYKQMGLVPGGTALPMGYAKPDVEKAWHGGVSGYCNGGSQMWDMGQLTIRAERTTYVPAFARIPYLNRITVSKKWVSEKYSVFLILTADVVEQDPVAAK